MVNGTTWEEETQALMRQAIQKQRLAEEAQKRAAEEVFYWAELVKTFEKSLEGRRKLNGDVRISDKYGIDPEALRKMSAREAIFAIGAANNDILVAIDVIKVMVDAGMFVDKEHARGAFYSAMYHNRRHFKKLRPGHYQVVARPNISMPLM